MEDKRFAVQMVTTVDRPELRGATFPRVAPGTRIPASDTFTSQAAAVREFERILGGCYDFAGEFVSAVEVVQLYTGRSPRTVRQRVVRERRETAREHRRAILAVGAARRGALWLAYFHVDAIRVPPPAAEEPAAQLAA